ncbi:MAG: NAD(P)/FAD-dependent oxidoreductase [Desulfobacterales bacterium]|nr:NAD(P)/FAD-dependent oxidoreductase [Desulfobacterales bacterium]
MRSEKDLEHVHIAIVGGGAAGMMAAITAARQGARVTMLEQQDRVGKKILATGNGRCNLTNVHGALDTIHGADQAFISRVVGQFPMEKTVEFFHALGACTRVEDGGRVFPLTGQASTVLDVLRFEIERLGVALRVQTSIESISRKGDSFLLRWPGGEEQADRVVVTTGGKAAPHLGGSESGITLLKDMGHTAVPVFPALVPLKTDPHFGPKLKGVKVFAKALLAISGKPAGREAGEVLFTEYGLSGPPILQLSRSAMQARLEQQPVSLSLDLFPLWSAEQLMSNLDRRFSAWPQAALDRALIGLMHKRLIPTMLHEAEIAEAHKPTSRVSREECLRIVHVLKNWTFEITGSLSWKEAQVMAGGIRTTDFSAATLESQLVKGLFAAGEVLDVVGDSGGYNLQWAWSSGYVAGLHSAQA